MKRDQSTLPVALSRHKSSSGSAITSSLSPAMMGVDVLRSGISARHLMFLDSTGTLGRSISHSEKRMSVQPPLFAEEIFTTSRLRPCFRSISNDGALGQV